jgi:hypothetical protein
MVVGVNVVVDLDGDGDVELVATVDVVVARQEIRTTRPVQAGTSVAFLTGRIYPVCTAASRRQR